MQEHLENQAIAERLESFATLLELAGANPYSAARLPARGRADPRDRGCRSRTWSGPGACASCAGSGRGIEGRLKELVETGEIAELEELEREVQPDLVGLGRYLGIGARQAVLIARTLGVRTAAELREAARGGPAARGAGDRAAEGGEAAGRARARGRAAAAARAAAPPGAAAARRDRRAARRRSRRRPAALPATRASASPWSSRPTSPAPVLDALRVAAGDRRPCSSARAARRAYGVTVEGVPVELVVAQPDAVRHRARCARPARPSTSPRSSRCPDAPDEEGVYRALGIPFVPARAARGAVPRRAAAAGRARRRSAATCTATRPGRTGRRASRRWRSRRSSAATSTSRSATTRRRSARCAGLTADDLRRQAIEIADANEALAPFRVLRGTECDILPDGQLDLPDSILAELDWVQASVHGGPAAAEAASRPSASCGRCGTRYVSCLSHPKGRYINRRPENELDIDRLIEVALEEGVALEVNGLPDRLDLRDVYVRQAVEAGVKIVCSTDAHSIRGLANMGLSVATARRGWATAADVLNTRPLDEVLAWRRR